MSGRTHKMPDGFYEAHVATGDTAVEAAKAAYKLVKTLEADKYGYGIYSMHISYAEEDYWSGTVVAM